MRPTPRCRAVRSHRLSLPGFPGISLPQPSLSGAVGLTGESLDGGATQGVDGQRAIIDERETVPMDLSARVIIDGRQPLSLEALAWPPCELARRITAL